MCLAIFEITYHMNSCSIFVKTMFADAAGAELFRRLRFGRGMFDLVSMCLKRKSVVS